MKGALFGRALGVEEGRRLTRGALVGMPLGRVLEGRGGHTIMINNYIINNYNKPATKNIARLTPISNTPPN